MNRTDAVVRVFFFLAGLPFLYYVVTAAPPDWLYYTSLLMIFMGLVYNLISDWRKGHKAKVKKRLMMYGVLLGISLLLIVFLKR